MDTIKISKEYLQWAFEYQQCILTGDYKKGNKYADKLVKYNQLFVKEHDKAVFTMIDTFVNSDNPGAVMWITPVCIKLQYRLPEVKEKVRSYIDIKELGLNRTNARILLEQLNETGDNM